MNQKRLLRRALLLATCGMLALAAQATEQYPSKLMTIVVGFPSGGATDVSARTLQPALQRALGQTIIVENVPGAGGSLGVRKVLAAPADGHVLFHGTASDTVLTPLTIASARYQPDSVRLVAVSGFTDFALVTRPGLSIDTLEALVAHLRDPGRKELSYASFGVGAANHLVTEHMLRKVGGRMVHVPYRGMAPSITELMGNQVDVAFMPLAGPIVSYIAEGKLKALAIAGPKRHPALPLVPTVDESASLPGFHFNIWLGFFVSSSTPIAAQQALNKALSNAIATPEFARFAQPNGITVPNPILSLKDAERFYARETQVYKDIARSIKLEPQ